MLLETLAKLLGATGVAIGVFYLLYRQLIDKVTFAGLTKKQTFYLLLVLLGAIWTFAVFVILAQGGVQMGQNNFNNVGGTVSVSN